MSRGPGRVQRAILDVLSVAALDTFTLSLHAGTSQESTRRALRSLRRAGRVTWLGFAGRGGGKWYLPEDAALYDVWPEASRRKLEGVLGPRSFASFRRMMVTCL